MALTLRLTDEEKTALQDIQSGQNIPTASGAIKYVLLDWRKREQGITALKNMLREARIDRDKALSDLNKVKDALQVLRIIAGNNA
jgi:hypothetical protein